MIDLHSHSTASDGSLTPAELVALARDSGLAVLGLTDHDTVDGIAAAQAAAAQHGLRLVPGLEFSAEYEPGTMHLLAYGIDPVAPALTQKLASLRGDRGSRSARIVARLCELGMPLTIEEVQAAAGGGSIGRPHVARAMIARGYVASTDEAFAQWLNQGRPGFVPQERIAPAEAIALTLQAGGVPVLAHPYQLKPTSSEHLEQIVRGLCDVGLQGIEVHYSRHRPEQMAEYAGLAQKYGLLVTGGSDFHGASKPDIRLGTGTGSLSVPEAALVLLLERIAENQAKAVAVR